MQNRHVWKVGYVVEVLEDGETTVTDEQNATVLSGPYAADLQRSLGESLVGIDQSGELDGEKWIHTIIGVRITRATTSAVLTDLAAEWPAKPDAA